MYLLPEARAPLDIIIGGNGNDTLSGGYDSDIIIGGSGNDDLVASSIGLNASPTLTGNTGADNFIFSEVYGIHTITDFVVAEDTLTVYKSPDFGFGNDELTPGAAITPAQFTIGSAASDASDRFIYNKNSGALFFDSDGTGAADQVQFAQLSTGLAMTNADIFVNIFGV